MSLETENSGIVIWPIVGLVIVCACVAGWMW